MKNSVILTIIGLVAILVWLLSGRVSQYQVVHDDGELRFRVMYDRGSWRDRLDEDYAGVYFAEARVDGKTVRSSDLSLHPLHEEQFSLSRVVHQDEEFWALLVPGAFDDAPFAIFSPSRGFLYPTELGASTGEFPFHKVFDDSSGQNAQ